eukprot:1561977-Rhodomonas_salina.2
MPSFDLREASEFAQEEECRRGRPFETGLQPTWRDESQSDHHALDVKGGGAGQEPEVPEVLTPGGNHGSQLFARPSSSWGRGRTQRSGGRPARGA